MPEIENIKFHTKVFAKNTKKFKNRTTGTIMTMVIEGSLYSIFSKRHIER